jgi:hypothetical protein
MNYKWRFELKGKQFGENQPRNILKSRLRRGGVVCAFFSDGLECNHRKWIESIIYVFLLGFLFLFNFERGNKISTREKQVRLVKQIFSIYF